MLIDEIHKSANFAAHLKAIRDTFYLQVIFSGSSALRLQYELADLSRRAVVYTMPVLSLREFLEIETEQSFEAYSSKLLEVINLTIDSDLSGIYGIDPSKLDKLKKLLYMLYSTNPVELNVSKLSGGSGWRWEADTALPLEFFAPI